METLGSKIFFAIVAPIAVGLFLQVFTQKPAVAATGAAGSCACSCAALTRRNQ